MGTPSFGVPILEGLYIQYKIVGVVTQPDKPVGRKQEVLFSPVKQWAVKHCIKVFQPENIKTEYQSIKELHPDLIVTAAYGQFVGMELLNYPKYRSINVHASLLPKYRGGAPIHQAIKNGETETGISIIYMEKKMDAGNILGSSKVPILETDTGGSLFEKLSLVGRDCLIKVIDQMIQGTVKAIPQDESLATYAFNVSKEDERLDFSKTAFEVWNHIRAYNPTPGAYTTINGEVYKIYSSNISPMKHHQSLGSIIDITKNSFVVACGENTAIEITQIKPQGKNIMNVQDFLNGNGKNILKNIEKVGA